jgi:DNA-binding transcriptional ArsR family regulator
MKCSKRWPTLQGVRCWTGYASNGQTLDELCDGLAMTRQAVTKHLAILEAANLVTTFRRGREKLHYINPVPIHQTGERWIRKFERGKLTALSELKRQLENAISRPEFVYTIYIASTLARVWEALTTAELSRQYFFNKAVEVDLKVGGTFVVRAPDGSLHIGGEVFECAPRASSRSPSTGPHWSKKLGPTLVT